MLPKDEDPRIIFEFKSRNNDYRLVRLRNDPHGFNRNFPDVRSYQIQLKQKNSMDEVIWTDTQKIGGKLSDYADEGDFENLVIIFAEKIEFLNTAIGPRTTPMPDVSNELDTESVI